MPLKPSVAPLLLALSFLFPLIVTPSEGAFPVQVEYPFTLKNPTPHPREETVWFRVAFHPGDIVNPENFRVYRVEEGGRREVPSDYLPSTVERYPTSPSIRSMVVVIRDRLEGGEEGSYILVAGAPPPLRPPSMTAAVTPPMIVLRDGETTWQISTTQSVLSTNVYILYTNGSRRAVTSPLIPVNGNQLTPDQISFAMLWGEPTYMDVEVRSLLAHITLRYGDAKMVQWGYGATQEQIEHTDIISAELDIYIPSGEARAYIYATKNLHERIYNHNGFLYEFSSIYGPDDRYECIYGTEDLFRMYGRSSAPTWRRGETHLEDSPPGNRSSPAFMDVDSDGDLDMLIGYSDGEIYLLRNGGTSHTPYFSSPKPYLRLPHRNISLATGDMNLDGIQDIVIGEATGEVHIIYGGMGGIGEEPPTGVKVPSEASPAVGDLNGDGVLDMIVGDGERGIYLYWGKIEEGFWRGVRDDTVLYSLNHGATQQPAFHPHPTLCDTDMDGDLDLIIGEREGDFGAVSFYYNTGNRQRPEFVDLYPAMFNNVRGGRFISPTFADLQDDGLPELVHGSEEGWIRIYNNTGNSSAERHVNTMQPLENGTYRFYWDKDGNDGQYVIRGYQRKFDGYYVLATPKAGHASMTFLNNYLNYVHRDRYYGDLYPWAGGNVSYYPFVPEEDGYVTRGILISSAFKTSDGGGMGAGSFISQTGTASGFIQVPLEARTYHTDYAFLADLPYDEGGELYRRQAALLSNPIVVGGFLNIAVNSTSVHISPEVPSSEEPFRVSFGLLNPSSTPSGELRVRVALLWPTGDTQNPIEEQRVDIEGLSGGGERVVEVTMQPPMIEGPLQLYIEVVPLSDTPETRVEDNVCQNVISFSPQRFTADDIQRASRGPYNSVSTYLVEGEGGTTHLLFSEYTILDRYDLMDRLIPAGSEGKGGITTVREGGHICVDGAGVYRRGEGLISLYSSNINELNDYLRTRRAIYYWSEKFDLWESVWEREGWGRTRQVTSAEARNDSDQDPDLFLVGEEVWATFRQTHLDLYTNGHQMDNVPFLDYRILLLKRNNSGWADPFPIFYGEGAGWWRGPQGAALGGAPSCVFESRGGQGNVWDIWLVRYMNGEIISRKLTDSPMPQIRPELVSFPRGGVVLWEERRSNGGYTVYLQPVDETGEPTSDPIPISEGLEDAIKVRACAGGGGKVVAAVYEGLVDGQKDIFLSLYETSRGALYGPFRLTSTQESEEEPDILINNRGDVVVAWERTDSDRIRRVYYTTLKGPVRVLGGDDEVEAEGGGEVEVRIEMENALGEILVSPVVEGAPLRPVAGNLTLLEGRHTYLIRLRADAPLRSGMYSVQLRFLSPEILLPPSFCFTLVVRPPTNNPPEIVRASVPEKVLPGEEVLLEVEARDPDGDEIFFSWWADRGSFPGGREGPRVSWRAPEREGWVQIGVNVSDLWGGREEEIFRVRVRENSPPYIVYFELADRMVRAGEVFEVRWGAADPDGDDLSISLHLSPTLKILENTTSSARLISTGPGTCEITLVVTDEMGASCSDTISFEVLPPLLRPEVLTVEVPAEARPGQLVNVSIIISYGGEVEELTVKVLFRGRWYSAVFESPINETASLWSLPLNLPEDIPEGNYSLKVRVLSPEGEDDVEEVFFKVVAESLEPGEGVKEEGLRLPYFYLAALIAVILVILVGFYLIRRKGIHPRGRSGGE